MRTFLTLGVLLAAAPLFAATPNVIFILADDLGCFELGCYGQTKIKTPHIDRLAKEGLKFTQFYAGNAVCAPSRCSLMTGQHPGHATIRNNREVKPEGQHPINASDFTLAEMFKKQGYATGAVGKWGLGMFDSDGSPLKHGFDAFYGYNCQRHAHNHYPTYLYRNDARFELKGNDLKGGDSWSHDLFEKESLAFLDANAAKPFFLYLPFTVPHVAVQAPDDAVAEYRGKLGPDPAFDGTLDGKPSYQPHATPHAGYAAMVSRLDATVGKIVAKLKALKIDDHTVIFFTSDNGPTFQVGGADSVFFESAGNLRGLKGSLYEGGLRVPMLVRWPSVIKPGRVCDEAFAFWDVMPTLTGALGAELPKGDGVSFLPMLRGEPQLPHEFLYWEFSSDGGQQAVRKGNWKAVRQKMKEGVKTALYDLAADPGEKVDVAATQSAMLKELEAILAREHVPNMVFPLPGVDKK